MQSTNFSFSGLFGFNALAVQEAEASWEGSSGKEFWTSRYHYDDGLDPDGLCVRLTSRGSQAESHLIENGGGSGPDLRLHHCRPEGKESTGHGLIARNEGRFPLTSS